jgi:AcrR family transcriptional regulator
LTGGISRSRRTNASPARTRAPRLSAADRRAQLLAVAREVFADRGFAASSVEEIAKRAGVSKPVIYEHFGGKDGVYAVVIEREIRELVGRINTALRPGHPRASITDAVDTFLAYIEDTPDGFIVLMRDAPIGTDSTLLPSVLDEIARAVEKLLVGELTGRGYPSKMAPVLARSLVGMIAVPGQWWLRSGRQRRKHIAEQIVNLAWNGLAGLQH